MRAEAADAAAEAAAIEAAVAAVAAAEAQEAAAAEAAAAAAASAASASVAALAAAAAPPAAVPLDELIAATDGFAEARKVGEGGFGRVYRADALPSLLRVACGFAVKTALVGVGAQGLAELQGEVRTLSPARPRSLLPLPGSCLVPPRPCPR